MEIEPCTICPEAALTWFVYWHWSDHDPQECNRTKHKQKSTHATLKEECRLIQAWLLTHASKLGIRVSGLSFLTIMYVLIYASRLSEGSRHVSHMDGVVSVHMSPCMSMVMWKVCTRSPLGGRLNIVECVGSLLKCLAMSPGLGRAGLDRGRGQVPHLA